jgi:hypothetical protein
MTLTGQEVTTMPSPFPGMDPYLERPALWPDVHLEIMRSIRAALTPKVAPNYFAAVEQRTYITYTNPTSFLGRPDVVSVGPQRQPGIALPSGNGGAAVLERPLTLALPMPDQVIERYLEIRDGATHQPAARMRFSANLRERTSRGSAIPAS